MKKLAGKVAIVTGASKGIGAAAAKALAAEGAAGAVNNSSGKQGAERVVSQIRREDGKAIAIQAHIQSDRRETLVRGDRAGFWIAKCTREQRRRFQVRVF
jgi:NAD(P)-dependent dehydrogenase (short-subunit alcohol dehydrogenase family)